MKISQLCFTYDEAQNASRDPRRREQRNHYLKIVSDYRRNLSKEVLCHMQMIASATPTSDPGVQFAVRELAYFNAWFNLRGGWEGLASS
jgi:hypothetical protein